MKKLHYTPVLTCAGLLCIMLANHNAYAQSATPSSTVQVNRYVTRVAKPTSAQINPLLAVISVRFPASVLSIEDAMRYVLRHSGYTLAPIAQRTNAEATLLQQPLPLVNRTLMSVSVQEALQTLAGKAIFTLVQDPLHRWVSFRLTPDAKTLWHHYYAWELS